VTRDAREVLGNPQWKRMALGWVRLGPKLDCQALLAGGGSSISLFTVIIYVSFFLMDFLPKLKNNFSTTRNSK